MKKLRINKVTLRDLDEPTLQGMAGGAYTQGLTCNGTCPADTCKACLTQAPKLTCCGKCNCTT